MIQFLKELFCFHDYKVTEVIGFYRATEIKTCSKCGKKRRTPHNDIFG